MMIFDNPPVFDTNDDGFVPPAMGGTIGVLVGTIEFDDVGAKTLFTIPAGAVPVNLLVSVVTDFNAATTNTLDIGLGSDGDYFANDLDVGTQANFDPTSTNMVAGRYGVQLADEETLTVEYSQSGIAATTGKANIILFYMLGGEVYVAD